ncbi:hypothetical protein DIE04_02205 [Burkholderia sp. Bp8994]|nr:hypothetical protein DIE12_12330 [Burkholderia sp. Bp9015]RQS01168.1 hypothetical protein DIE04_02205 [Burkholderia sp. Bp8994]RQZ38326.1 hypothetical protein DIE16_16255 [Burkholderia sp. Bp9090]
MATGGGGAAVRRHGIGRCGAGAPAAALIVSMRLPRSNRGNTAVSACYHRRVSTLSRPAALQGSQAGATAAPGEGMPPRFH